MAQFVPFEKNIEVNGATIYSIIDGFGNYKTMAIRYLLDQGIGKKVGNDLTKMGLNDWYPQVAWLKVFEMISKQAGDVVLQKIGRVIPDNSVFPPGINDCESAVRALNISYHMNHRKNGQIMYNEKTGELMEGIGDLHCKKMEGQNLLIVECWNPYPCSFEFGIISAIVSKTTLAGTVAHDNTQPCRKNGADSCNYIVTW